MSDPLDLDAIGQAQLVQDGQITPAELVDAAVARIEELNPRLNAVVYERFERARAEAAQFQPRDHHLFAGVPFVHKDLDGFTAGDPYTGGGRFLRDAGFVADRDSYLCSELRAAGMILVGKTNCPEMGLLPTTEPEVYGPTHNPWSLDHSPSGSSGGSAAAVAARMVAVGHAGDGGGSIRTPSSACGVVGLKPSRGRVSLGPDEGESWGGFVTWGAITRSVRDTAGILDVISGPVLGDPYSAPEASRPYADEVDADVEHLRVGVLATVPSGIVEVHPDCVDAAEYGGELLDQLGHGVEAAYPEALEELEPGQHFMGTYGSFVAHGLDHWSHLAGRPATADDVEPMTWALAEMGRGTTAAQYLDAKSWLQGWSRRIGEWWNTFDLLVTPTMGEPPTRLGEFASTPDSPFQPSVRATGLVPFTLPFNITGQPAISLPLHWNGDGLPVGVQLVAAYGREDLLIRVASQLEEARPWADRTPPVTG